MSIKRIFSLFLISIFSISIFSCNVKEEETDVKFEWNHVQYKADTLGNWKSVANNKYVVDEYYTYKDSNQLLIKGYTLSGDSIDFRFVKHAGKNFTVGDYVIGSSTWSYNLVFWNKGLPTFPTEGTSVVTEVNSRVDFTFNGPMSNTTITDRYEIRGGIALNLDLYKSALDTIQ